MSWTTYECPKCGHAEEQRTGARVWHRCPQARRDVEMKAKAP